jgi:hypothetical protein
MPGLRQLGVYGANNPTKKGSTVQPAAFTIAGLIGQMERRFDIALPVSSPQDVQTIFGGQVDSAKFAPDVVDGFFKNLGGQNAVLYIYSSPNAATGTPGALTDTQASMALPDLAAAGQRPLTITPAWQGNAEYGLSGNRTGVRIESWASGSVGAPVFGTSTWPTGFRGFTQAAAITVNLQNTVQLNSVLDLVVGDILAMYDSAHATYLYSSITQINAGTKVVTIADAWATASRMLAVNDYVFAVGFRVHTYRQNLSGVEVEVDASLGQIWLSLNSADSNHYPPAIFNSQANFISIGVNSTSTTVLSGNKMPQTLATTIYPTGTLTGSTLTAGTEPTPMTTAGQYNRAFAAFNALPVRFLAMAETTDQTIQQALESYCANRALGDNPIAVVQIASNQTKAQLSVVGTNWQKGGESDAVLIGHWGQRQDPFSLSSLTLPRNIPLVGHVMGIWCQSIAAKGIHFVPCTKDMAIQGLVGIVGTQFTIPTDRTDLANVGINCVEFLPGYGYVLRNLFTPSTAVEFSFANGLLMRNYIKASVVGSLQTSENTPNSLTRIQDDKNAVLGFMYGLWNVGSTGNIPPGETFGQVLNADGSATRPTDHFEVRADAVNNPVSSLQAGNRNLDVYFTYPAPAVSIKIGVGIMLRG